MHGKIRDFRHAAGRRGYFTGDQLTRIRRDAERCISQAFEGMPAKLRPPSRGEQRDGTDRVWVELWGDRQGKNGFGEQ